MRVGFGYDVHRLVSDRPLILGGVEVEFELGLLGHSDADVLVHAIMDALLGAAGLGDIGKHFPDTDEKFKGIASLLLLKKVKEILQEKGYVINNIDTTIVAQKPKLAPYLPEMQDTIAQVLEIKKNLINIKATTTEGLGFVGIGEGIASFAVCTIKKEIYITD